VIEQVTGQSLEQVAREMVYAPLGMSSSSFLNRAVFTPRTANGHLHAILPALLFAVFYLVSLVIAGIVGTVILRIRTGRWRPKRRMVMGILTTAFVLSLLPAFILFGMSSLLEFAWLIALCGLILEIAFAVTFLAGRVVIARFLSKRPGQQIALTILWSVLILVGLVLLTGNLNNLPVPKWPGVSAQAAGSMRATAGDMAIFLIDLSNPQHLGVESARQLQTSQVRLNSDLSWGLGPGIQHSRQGDAL
jgi:CubicO group peptidase (beta-lactamase class C family)